MFVPCSKCWTSNEIDYEHTHTHIDRVPTCFYNNKIWYSESYGYCVPGADIYLDKCNSMGEVYALTLEIDSKVPLYRCVKWND